METSEPQSNTGQKALQINLAARKFGVPSPTVEIIRRGKMLGAATGDF